MSDDTHDKMTKTLRELFGVDEIEATKAKPEDVSGLPVEPEVPTPSSPSNVVVGPWAGAGDKAKPAKTKTKAARRSEELDVVCRAAPADAQDCVGVPGWLVLDWRGDTVEVALFDPAFDDVENAEFLVAGQLVSDTRVTLTDSESDDGTGAPERWTFDVVEDADAVADAECDGDEIDFDAVEDDDIDWDHPFNEGLT